MRRREFIVIIISIAAAIVAGVGAIILPSLPIKWMIALILAISFVSILLITPDAERVILFTVVLIVPFTIGTTLPAFIEHPEHIGLSQTLDVQLIDILIFSLIVYRLVRLAARRDEIRFFPFITIPAFVWVFASALSLANAGQLDVALIQLGIMAKLWLLYIVVANSIKNEMDIKWLVFALLLGVFFQGILGIAQEAAGQTFGLSFLGEPDQLFDSRSSGTIGHPNGYGLYLAATTPLSLTLLFLDVRGLYKAMAGVVLSVGMLGLLFSLSRGGWLGFLTGAIVVVVIAIRGRRQSLKVVFVGASLMFITLIPVTFSQQNLITNRLTSTQANQSALSRITMGQGAIAMIKDYPVLGVGLNNYSFLMPEYDPVDYLSERRRVIVHNIYLLIAAETGLVGSAAFLWFVASLCIQAWRLASQALNNVVWMAGAGALSAYAALIVHGTVDYDMLANVTIFRLLWLFAAIIASLSEMTWREREESSHPQLQEYATRKNG